MNSPMLGKKMTSFVISLALATIGSLAVANTVAAATSTGTLHVNVVGESAPARRIQMGAAGQTLGAWTFRADGTDNVEITQLDVFNRNHAGDANIKNLSLWMNGTRVSTVKTVVSGAARFDALSIVVPRGGSVTVTLKGDITAVINGGVPEAQVQMSIAMPAKITGIGSDMIIAITRNIHGSNYVGTTGAGTYSANALIPTR